MESKIDIKPGDIFQQLNTDKRLTILEVGKTSVKFKKYNGAIGSCTIEVLLKKGIKVLEPNKATHLKAFNYLSQAEKANEVLKKFGDREELHIAVPHGQGVDYGALEARIIGDFQKRFDEHPGILKDVMGITNEVGLKKLALKIFGTKHTDCEVLLISALTDSFALADPGVVKRVLKKYPELMEILEKKK